MNGEVTQSSEVLDGIEVTHASDEREEKVKVQLLAHTHKRTYRLITQKLQEQKS